jgi:acetyltransferase-like isoleucine patch superfamily enzyme
VDRDAELNIGNNVGISQTAIVCHLRISIGNNVKIGAGVCIYDTDFHSLNPEIRGNFKLDMDAKIKQPVIIKDNAFIGAHSTILKGVTIGKNSVIGACSVVTKDVEDNEVWAGNPAKLVKKLPGFESIIKPLSNVVPEKQINKPIEFS